MLKRLLVRRFGSLPAWAEEQLGQANRASLECWGERILHAASLEEVFFEGE